MAAGTVDVCLIPEVKFATDGPKGLLAYLDHILAQKGHCTICMAEGAGQVTGWPYLTCMILCNQTNVCICFPLGMLSTVNLHLHIQQF